MGRSAAASGGLHSSGRAQRRRRRDTAAHAFDSAARWPGRGRRRVGVVRQTSCSSINSDLRWPPRCDLALLVPLCGCVRAASHHPPLALFAGQRGAPRLRGGRRGECGGGRGWRGGGEEVRRWALLVRALAGSCSCVHAGLISRAAPRGLHGAATPSTSRRDQYVGLHGSGFRDFMLKPEIMRAIVDCAFEHPSTGAVIGLRHAGAAALRGSAAKSIWEHGGGGALLQAALGSCRLRFTGLLCDTADV